MYLPRYKRVLDLLAIARRNPATRRLPDGRAISADQLRKAFVDLEHAAFEARNLGYLHAIPAPSISSTLR